MRPIVRWIKRLLPHGLWGRSLLIIVTPLVVVQVVSIYVFYARHWELVSRRLAGGLAGDVAAVIQSMHVFPGTADRARIMGIAETQMGMSVVLEPGRSIGRVRDHRPDGLSESSLYQALKGRVRRPFRVNYHFHQRKIAIYVQLPDGLLRVAVPRERLFSYTITLFLLWMGGTSMLLMVIATLFMRNQVRSVKRLAAAADSFGRGLDVPNFKPEGATEVRQAAQAFTLMRERIQRQIQQRTEMLAGVSHDLRTPLTRMKLQLAMMEGGEAHADLAEDVAEMERMIEGYLAFARGEGSEKPMPGDLAALVDTVVSRCRRQGGRIAFEDGGPIDMMVRPHALTRAVDNLIGNAMRYGGQVRVSVARRGDAAEIVVEDNGPGIPPDRREDVFKAFTRLESSRNPQTGGVGLGLTIARDVVRSHGGDIVLEDSPLGGLRARVRLPLGSA
jgi:two-component system osmolarity sensor histidine kinase EnvZ